jgi:drug/metabolite transporter (DMT)-like permease
VIFWKKLKQITWDYIKQGAIIGALLFASYSMQTIGITGTTPGKNAFLTAVYCVIVPFLFWITDKIAPDRYNISAAILCIVGIGLVSLTGDFTISYGDGFTLIGGFGYALHMVALAKFCKGKDPVLLTIVQFGIAALISWIVGLSFDSFPTQWSMVNIFEILYLAVFATTVAMLFQAMGQKHCHPSAASIILSLESVLGVAFSIVLYGEQLSLRLVVGFLFIFAAVITSETKLSFLRNK